MTEVQFTASRGRKFAFTLAASFGLIALVALWRERHVVSIISGTLALSMFLSGFFIPERLEPVESLWMKLAHAISRVTTPIFMGIVYFVVLTPVGLVRRIAGANSLVHRPADGSYWVRRPSMAEEKARNQMERQF